MNIIRGELNALGGNYGQRLEYNAFPAGLNNYIPFSIGAQNSLKIGLAPGAVPGDKFIRFK